MYASGSSLQNAWRMLQNDGEQLRGPAVNIVQASFYSSLQVYDRFFMASCVL